MRHNSSPPANHLGILSNFTHTLLKHLGKRKTLVPRLHEDRERELSNGWVKLDIIPNYIGATPIADLRILCRTAPRFVRDDRKPDNDARRLPAWVLVEELRRFLVRVSTLGVAVGSWVAVGVADWRLRRFFSGRAGQWPRRWARR